MRAPSGWIRGQILVALGFLLAPGCATPIEDTLPPPEDPPDAGVGGSTAGMTGAGGSTGAVGGTGGTGGTAGTGTGGASSGGTGGSSTGGASGAMGGGKGGGGSGGSTGGAGGSTSAGSGGKGGSTSAGSGGKGGAGGTGGTTGGSAGTGGKAGGGGKGGTGAAGGSATAEGCAELSVPMNGASDKAHFTISLSSAADLSAPGTTISLRIYVEDGDGGRIFPYVQDANYDFLGPPGPDRALLAEQKGWQTITWDVGAEPVGTSAVNKSNITRIGIEIQAAGSMDWSNPTIVYVDSITVDDPELAFNFGRAGTISTAGNQTTDLTSQDLWLNAGSMDTTATGTELGWVETCP